VKLGILVWARESAGYTFEETAASPGPSEAPEWGAGTLRPTINQPRLLVRRYRRSLAVFYLQQRPTDLKPIPDLRKHPATGVKRMSPRLRLEIRETQQNREIALDLLEETEEDLPPFSISARLKDDHGVVGRKVRRFLRVSDGLQRSWLDPAEAFRGWRALIEEAGMLVFQVGRTDAGEASGLAVSGGKLPAIAVNRSGAPVQQTFSPLHELAHLLPAQSGVSRPESDLARPPCHRKIEVWRDAVAVAAMLPCGMLLDAGAVQGHERGNPVWDEQDIAALSTTFGVSRTLIVCRMLTLGLTNRAFFREKEEECAKDRFVPKRSSGARGDSGHRAISLFGRNFVGMVLSAYHEQEITLRDVSNYLKIKMGISPKSSAVYPAGRRRER